MLTFSDLRNFKFVKIELKLISVGLFHRKKDRLATRKIKQLFLNAKTTTLKQDKNA